MESDLVVASVWASTVLLVAMIAALMFRRWLNHQRRFMVHKERLAAIEKGIALPELEREVDRVGRGSERILLLSGVRWISLGATGGFVLRMLAGKTVLNGVAPFSPELSYLALIPLAIGLSHLIAWSVGERRGKEGLSRSGSSSDDTRASDNRWPR